MDGIASLRLIFQPKSCVVEKVSTEREGRLSQAFWQRTGSDPQLEGKNSVSLRVSRVAAVRVPMALRGLTLAVLGLLLAFSVAEDDIDGCGGFVRASGELGGGGKPDLSMIKAVLVSSDGTVKSEVECSPNGYYYMPMYDKSQYKIRVQGPVGYIFSPKEAKVGCSQDPSFQTYIITNLPPSLRNPLAYGDRGSKAFLTGDGDGSYAISRGAGLVFHGLGEGLGLVVCTSFGDSIVLLARGHRHSPACATD